MTFVQNSEFEILTPTGWQNFEGVSQNGIRKTIKIIFEDLSTIECTEEHPIYISLEQSISAGNLHIGDIVYSLSGDKKIICISPGKADLVFDVIGVDNGNKFYANDILVSNCLFVRWDETLINSVKLMQLEGIQPTKKFDNQVRWYKEIEPKSSYVVALDPSMGTGGDNSAIEVFELPSMQQVAEWQHNKSAIEQQLSILKSINQEIHSHGQPTLYWSVENNSLGEAALVVIREVGEESFAGMMIHDPQRGHGKGRRGFTTTVKNKVEACAKLKSWIEKDKMKINSKNLISEFKNFVRSGETYKAKTGSTDDLVMATVLAARMIKYISSFDDSTYGTINTTIDDLDDSGDFEMPMPIMVV